ncbi:MAG TPA: signal peptidase II [Rhodanobacteraceae bacterium]
MKSTRPGALPWLGLSALIIVLDQWSKLWVRDHTLLGQQVPVIHGFLYRTLWFNRGAAWSFLAGSDGWQRWFFVILAFVICAGLGVWLYRTARRDWRTALPLALIIGGALGNVVDRIRVGRVTDFVLVYFGQWAYPAFNLADSCICVGAVLLIAFSVLGGKAKQTLH